MIRKIMDLEAYRRGIAQWNLLQTHEAMEMGFDDVVQPVFVMERDSLLFLASLPYPAQGVGIRVVYTTGSERQLDVYRLEVRRTAGDRILDFIALRNLGWTRFIVLAWPASGSWVSGPMDLSIPSNVEIITQWSGGTVDSVFEFGILARRVY